MRTEVKMVSQEDKNWIRIFDVPEVSKHKKGFTIYKIISMLYPESCPDAITKITVWKRYNDIKKLHGEMKLLHQSLKIGGKLPSLPGSTYFKRFNAEIIQERKHLILNFLEYISLHSVLFTANAFVKFFETSHTPSMLLNSTINSIRAELNLPSEPEFLSLGSPESDDDCNTVSDTDSISTLGTGSLLGEPIIKSQTCLTKLSRQLSQNSHDTVSVTTIDFPTPAGLQEVDGHYIIEAGKYILLASQFESDKRYPEAFTAYKQAIDVLLTNGRDDKDYERRQMVRYKTEKYLLRAEKICNLYICPDVPLLQTYPKETKVQHPVSDLHKYKVIKVADGGGMMALHSISQNLLYVKVIQKTCYFQSDCLILPTKVPFMIELDDYYNSENALFLILKYCSGVPLWDFLNNKGNARPQHQSKEFDYQSDNESEGSFSDLLNEYNSNRSKVHEDAATAQPNTIIAPNIDDDPNDIVKKSQNLLSSIDVALNKTAEINYDDFEFVEIPKQRKFSESSASVVEDDEALLANRRIIPLRSVVKWSAQLLLAIEALHKAGVTCCDLQFKNLLIDENDDLCLTYMYQTNERKVFSSGKDLAPEMYTLDGITKAVDWWSYGTILYEMLAGVSIRSLHPEGILCYTTLKIPRYVIAEGKSLLRQLLAYDPTIRLGCGPTGTQEIKTHPFFNAIQWDPFRQCG